MSPQTVRESNKSDLCDAYEEARGLFTVSVEGQGASSSCGPPTSMASPLYPLLRRQVCSPDMMTI